MQFLSDTFVFRMSVKYRHIKIRFVSILFLLLIGGVIVNSTFFLHAHKSDGGKIIFHAHPFDKGAESDNPLAQHKHNKIDLATISSIDHFLLKEINIKINYNWVLESELLSKPCLKFNSKIYNIFSTRGPPQIIFV